jgi:predicted RNA-binding Zn-ribbon protein involved in translation (DUF1610 family)
MDIKQIKSVYWDFDKKRYVCDCGGLLVARPQSSNKEETIYDCQGCNHQFKEVDTWMYLYNKTGDASYLEIINKLLNK